jgi:hypothetical protein
MNAQHEQPYQGDGDYHPPAYRPDSAEPEREEFEEAKDAGAPARFRPWRILAEAAVGVCLVCVTCWALWFRAGPPQEAAPAARPEGEGRSAGPARRADPAPSRETPLGPPMREPPAERPPPVVRQSPKTVAEIVKPKSQTATEKQMEVIDGLEANLRKLQERQKAFLEDYDKFLEEVQGWEKPVQIRFKPNTDMVKSVREKLADPDRLLKLIAEFRESHAAYPLTEAKYQDRLRYFRVWLEDNPKKITFLEREIARLRGLVKK